MLEVARPLAEKIKLLILDVDGVLTDGHLVLSREGEELKSFSVRDGIGIKLAQFARIEVAFLSARVSEIVRRRAEMLGVAEVRQGEERKLGVVKEMAARRGIGLDEIAYLGDDVVDLESIRAVGLGAAVSDACGDLLATARFVTETRGGEGAVREVVEAILKSRGDWHDVVRGYLASV